MYRRNEVLTQQYENQNYDNAYERIWEIPKMANFHFWPAISLQHNCFFSFKNLAVQSKYKF